MTPPSDGHWLVGVCSRRAFGGKYGYHLSESKSSSLFSGGGGGGGDMSLVVLINFLF